MAAEASPVESAVVRVGFPVAVRVVAHGVAALAMETQAVVAMEVVGRAMVAAEAVPVAHCVGAPVGGVVVAARAVAARVATRVATWVAAAVGGEDTVEATMVVVEARAVAVRVVASYASVASRQRASSGYGWI